MALQSLTARLLAGLLVLAGLGSGAVAGSGTASANGCITPAAGTSADPFLIENASNLDCLFGNPVYYWHQGYYFKQTADVSMTSYGAYAGGIGDDTRTFNGTYDGNGKTITGLRIAGAASVGMFGVTSGATISDLTLVDDSISGTSRVGGLVGTADDTTVISNVHADGRVSSSESDAGGLVGLALDATRITSSSADVDVAAGVGGNAGGLVGRAQSASGPIVITNSSASGDAAASLRAGGLLGAGFAPLTIDRSYATGDDTADSEAGALAGYLVGDDSSSVTVSQSFATGRTWNDSGSAGGLVGTLDDQGSLGLVANTITDSYATGQVRASSWAGGIVGRISADHAADWSIVRTYSTGALQGADDSTGGIVGEMDPLGSGTVTSSFWNATDSGGQGSSPYGTESTASAMRSPSLYAGAGWGIASTTSAGSTWGSCPALQGGLPFLQWYADQQGWACAPPPPTPPGPPTAVIAVAGDASARVSWTPPASTGSFPVTTYLATSTPGGRTCLASALACEVTGLANGMTYTFTVQALSGGGWGPSSVASNPVIPTRPPRPSIVISGARSLEGVTVAGTTSGFGMGGLVTPWLRRGAGPYEAGREVLVDSEGRFTWSRRVRGAVVWVSFSSGTTRSNALRLPSPR